MTGVRSHSGVALRDRISRVMLTVADQTAATAHDKAAEFATVAADIVHSLEQSVTNEELERSNEELQKSTRRSPRATPAQSNELRFGTVRPHLGTLRICVVKLTRGFERSSKFRGVGPLHFLGSPKVQRSISPKRATGR